MSDQEFAKWLGSIPREKPVHEVHEAERKRDTERGEFIAPSHISHHWYGEARH